MSILFFEYGIFGRNLLEGRNFFQVDAGEALFRGLIFSLEEFVSLGVGVVWGEFRFVIFTILDWKRGFCYFR